MSGRTIRHATDKVIHIRLDEVTHQRLKVEAAASKTTIQEIVENMLKRKCATKK
jgi:predicted HicB family RNase H-like nuclease